MKKYKRIYLEPDFIVLAKPAAKDPCKFCSIHEKNIKCKNVYLTWQGESLLDFCCREDEMSCYCFYFDDNQLEKLKEMVKK